MKEARSRPPIPPHEPEEGCISTEDLRQDVETAEKLAKGARPQQLEREFPSSVPKVSIPADRPQDGCITPEELQEEIRVIESLFRETA